MEKFIHIHAKCEAFEIFEQISEKKAIRRLTTIRKNFEWFQRRIGVEAGKLLVKTIVVNPEFQFHGV